MPGYQKKVKIIGKSAQDLYAVMEQEIDRFFQNASLGKYDLDKEPHSRKIIFKSAMASLELICSNEEISLDGKISLLAMPFKSKIDESISRLLKKLFGDLVKE